MKKIKRFETFERYLWIEDLFGDLEDFPSRKKRIVTELDKIEEEFSKLPKDQIEDFLIDLEEIGLDGNSINLQPFLWRGGELNKKKAQTSFGEQFPYFEISDFHKMSSLAFSQRPDIDYCHPELLDAIYKTKSREEFNQMIGLPDVKRWFLSEIRKDIDNFQRRLKEGWITSIALSPVGNETRFLKSWRLSPDKCDAIFRLTKRLEDIGWSMIFFPPLDSPKLLFVETSFIR